MTTGRYMGLKGRAFERERERRSSEGSKAKIPMKGPLDSTHTTPSPPVGASPPTKTREAPLACARARKARFRSRSFLGSSRATLSNLVPAMITATPVCRTLPASSFSLPSLWTSGVNVVKTETTVFMSKLCRSACRHQTRVTHSASSAVIARKMY